MENNIKVTFWLWKTKKNSKNLTPIYLRVTQNYDHFVKSTGIWIHAGDWDKKAMRIKGATDQIQSKYLVLKFGLYIVKYIGLFT